MQDIGNDKRVNTAENGAHRLVGDALDDIDINSHRGRDQTHFRNPDNQDSEPDGVKIQAHDHREKDGDGQQNNGHGIHDAPEHGKEKKDTRKDDIPIHRKVCNETRHLKREPRNGEKISQDHSAHDDDEYHSRISRGIDDALLEIAPG